MKGLKIFLLGFGVLFLVVVTVVILVGIQQENKQSREEAEFEQMSIDDIRSQAGPRQR